MNFVIQLGIRRYIHTYVYECITLYTKDNFIADEDLQVCLGASIPTSSISMMRPNIEVICIVKFQYATSAMLALPYDYFLVSLLFLDVPITVIVPSLLLTSFLNVFI